MKNIIRINDIITSQSTVDNENDAFLLGLYYVIDSDNRFYYYTGDIDNIYIVQLAEMYINNFASVKVFSADMYTTTPMHVSRYKHLGANINSTLLVYHNGGVCLDQKPDSKVSVHVWIEKSVVSNFEIIKPENFVKLTSDMPL